MIFSLGDNEIVSLQMIMSSLDQSYESQIASRIRSIINNCLSTGTISTEQRKKLLLLLSLPKTNRIESENNNSSEDDSLKYNHSSDDDSNQMTQRVHVANEAERVFRQQMLFQRRFLPICAFAIYALPFAVAGYHHAKKQYYLKGAMRNMATQQGKDFRASLKANVNHKQAQQAAQSKAKKNSGGEQRERTRGGEGRSR